MEWLSIILNVLIIAIVICYNYLELILDTKKVKEVDDMKKEKIIEDKRYHTCGRCKWNNVDDDSRPCDHCIYSMDKREDLWEYVESEDKK